MAEFDSDICDGLDFQRICKDDFRIFARFHGSSEEIGRIGTYLDADCTEQAYGKPYLFGLFGCRVMCAVVCCTIAKNSNRDVHACKLDSVIVHQNVRKGGLGSLLVTKAFLDLLGDPEFDIGTIYGYAVHPATVRMLRRLEFGEPPPTGAPLAALRIDADNRERLTTNFRVRFQDASQRLRLQCAYCLNKDRRARPWCLAHRTSGRGDSTPRDNPL